MTATNPETLEARFKAAHNKRHGILKQAIRNAAISKPWVLPDEDQQEDDELPENFQSVGSRGATTVEGKLLFALYPPGAPFFQMTLAPHILYDPNVPEEQKTVAMRHLGMREMMVTAVLEGRQLQRKGEAQRRRITGFRSRKRAVLSEIIITGDALEQLTDDYQLKSFRRDQYITKRDSGGDVLYHMIREQKDAFALTDEEFAKSELNRDELAEKPIEDRIVDIYTVVEWNPQSKVWVIRQEANGHDIITPSVEPVSPYFATPYELATGENYGRGLIELNYGDLRSYNELREKLIDFAALASKHLAVLDQTATIREEDLKKKTGSVIQGKVRDGKVQDAAWLTVDKAVDFNVVNVVAQEIRKDLGAAMLLESETQPRGERVTATQIQRIAMELEGTFGGVYAPIADCQQVPLLERTIWQMERDNIIPKLPKNTVELRVLTGMEALSREIDAAKLMDVTQMVAALGPEAVQKLNLDVLVDTLIRYKGFYEPGVVKTNKQLAEERKQAMAEAIAAQAASKAIDVAGNVAEQQGETNG